MNDVITRIYYLIDDSLPMLPLESNARQALEDTLTEDQKALYEDYQMECFRNTEAERLQLFRYLLSLHRLL